ncbi:MAG: MBL fold metallo-hydrolase [Candidatus Micrarchaeota archaeon]
MDAERILDGLGVIYGEDLSSNVYLIEDKKKGVLAIDAGAYPVIEKEPSMLILTHAHFDHAGGVDDDWKNVYLHKDDFFDGPYFKIPAQAKEINFEKIKWGKFEFEILHTPGHTLGSICLLERGRGVLISGDTLFADGVGRTDLGGDEKLMVKSLFRLRKLEWKILCPGHGDIANR